MNLNFGQLSANLIHCAPPRTNVEPRYPGLDYTLQSFGLSSAAWYITVVLGKWRQGATKNSHLQQPGRQLIHICCLKSDRGTQITNPGSVQCMTSHSTSLRFISMLFSHLSPGLPSGLFLSGNSRKTCITSPVSHTCHMLRPSLKCVFKK